MDKYQIIFIVEADKETKAQAQKVTKLITELKGELDETKPLGKKPLAYPIKKKTEGEYYQVFFRLDKTKVTQLTKELFQKDLVLRFLILKR